MQSGTFTSENARSELERASAGTEGGILSRAALVEPPSGDYFRSSLAPDRVSRNGERALEMVATTREIGKPGPSW